ncbi:MAG: hypothetical protein WCK28_20540, partial [Burkholderiales bacterium]
PTAGELKTKPTQHSVKELLSVGIQPNMLICRSDREIPSNERRKIALFCNVRPDAVVAALDVDTIYAVPISYHQEGLDREPAPVGQRVDDRTRPRVHGLGHRTVEREVVQDDQLRGQGLQRIDEGQADGHGKGSGEDGRSTLTDDRPGPASLARPGRPGQ